MKKVLRLGEENRKKILEGVSLMYEYVGATYSPAGQNIIIERQFGTPKVLHDGVSVAKEVASDDETINLGIELIREAAQSQVASTGDGTSATTILTYHLVTKGNEIIEQGVNPMKLRKHILAAVPRILEELQKQTKEVKTHQDIKDIALISSDDEEIADAITSAVEKVGRGGLITPEINKRSRIEVEHTEGMQIDRGYQQQKIFVTDTDRMLSVIENASILLLNRKITMDYEILPLLQIVAGGKIKNKHLVIIGDVEGAAMQILMQQKYFGNMRILVVPPPGIGETRRNVYEDISLVTGAKIVDDTIGLEPKEVLRVFNSDWVGSAKKVIASRSTTNIIKYEKEDFASGEGREEIEARNKIILEQIERIKALRDSTDIMYDKEQYIERLSRLTTGVAVIKVGARSEIITNEKMERVKDAIPAVQAAVEEGIVPGGALTFLKLSRLFQHPKNAGEEVLKVMLEEPIKKILTNAGEDLRRIDSIIDEITKKGGNNGYNVVTDQVEDLMKSGVIDPAKVIRLAIENAVEIGTSILTAKGSIANKKKEENNQMVMA